MAELEEDIFLDSDDNGKDVDYQPKKKKQKKKGGVMFERKVSICKEMKKWPCIYDITNKEYRNLNSKDAGWNDILSNVNNELDDKISMDEVKSLWKQLCEAARYKFIHILF